MFSRIKIEFFPIFWRNYRFRNFFPPLFWGSTHNFENHFLDPVFFVFRSSDSFVIGDNTFYRESSISPKKLKSPNSAFFSNTINFVNSDIFPPVGSIPKMHFSIGIQFFHPARSPIFQFRNQTECCSVYQVVGKKHETIKKRIIII